MRVHLDTDLGTNPDDVGALAYLLAREDVELTGITVVDDPDGRRLALAHQVMRLAGRSDLPLAGGTGAVDVLAESVARGAVLAGIGPASNLAALEARVPGTLTSARVVLMGGWPMPPDDHNARRDLTAATEAHRAAGALTLVPKSVTARVVLRDGDLARVARCGPVCALLAQQVAAYVASGRAYAHNDPLTVAVATGWDGVRVEVRSLGGREVDVVGDVDAEGFAEHWVRTLEGRVPT